MLLSGAKAGWVTCEDLKAPVDAKVEAQQGKLKRKQDDDNDNEAAQQQADSDFEDSFTKTTTASYLYIISDFSLFLR